MAIFSYSASDRSGTVTKGEREAENEKALAQALRAGGLLLLEAKEKSAAGVGTLAGRFSLGEILNRFRPVSLVDKMFFARHLSVMIAAGLSLTRAMEALSDESGSPRMRRVIKEVNDAVIQGKSFAEALRVHSAVFGDLFINMVEVGEATGKLSLVLRILAKQMKKDRDLRKRVKGAMMYPAIIIIALFGVGTMMMMYVVPTLAATIKELNVDLPWSTKLVLATSDFITAMGLWIFAALFVVVIIFWRALKTGFGKGLFDRIVIKVPLFGPLIIKFNLARLCRTLSYLITSGVPIVRSLEITSSVLGNTLFRGAVAEAAGEIQKGKPLHDVLRTYTALFSPLVIQMVSVGEETGKISSMLLRLALFFEEDVNSTTKNLSTIIEPVLMIIIGLVVGFFAVSMLQPIYSSVGNL